jgi:alpha-tubulin suppressor-like RCC1 family protein
MVGGGAPRYSRGTRVTDRRSLGLIGLVCVLAACGWLALAPGLAAAAPATTRPATALYVWGDNSYGQLGDGSTTSSSVPVRVTLPGGVTPRAVSEGYRTSLAVGSDGGVYAWGDNQFGQLGDGSTTEESTPVRVSLPGGVRAIAVSEGFDTSLALGSNGTVYAWGDNTSGQLGDGTATGPGTCGNSPCSTTPVAVSLPRGVRATAVSEGGLDTSFALGSDGRVYAWGDNRDGQLGDGTTTGPQTCGNSPCSTTPVAVSLPRHVRAAAVSAGGATTLALTWNGRVYAWGDNSSGQLGNGSTTEESTPVLVSLPSGVRATAVSAGGATSLARTWYGRVYAWGDNSSGQLGDGSTTDSSTPVLVSLPRGVRVITVSEGTLTSLAIGRGPTTAPVATTTMLTASPNPATTDATVTLTATEVAADGTHPAGSVQFSADGTDIGSPVKVTSGSASTTVTFAAAGTEALSAVFTPASAHYAISAGELSLVVTGSQSPGGGGSGCGGDSVGGGNDNVVGGNGELITVTLPQCGTFTVSIAPGTVLLTVSGSMATGTLEDITVTDTRNSYPGWSASGQASSFTGSGSAAGFTISGNQLGWTPAAVGPLQGGATLGPAVAPAAPGLGTTAGVLASAASGSGGGTNVLTANLDLLIPAAQQPGPYAGSLTITYVESAL